MESVIHSLNGGQLSENDLLMAQGGSTSNLDDWRYEMRREIQEILPNIFLGPFSACRDISSLAAKGITHIVCFFDCHEAALFKTRKLESIFQLTCIEVSDSPLQNLIPQFPTATKLFNNALAAGGKVLACCIGGMSRSPTFVIAYIMETFRVDFIRAYHFVQGKRLCINPNEGFKSQLKEYEPIYSAWSFRGSNTAEEINRQTSRRRPAPDDDDEPEDMRRHPRVDSHISADHDRASAGISGMIFLTTLPRLSSTMLDSQQAAYDRFKESSHRREERDHSQKRARLASDTSLPKLNSVHQGRVVKIMEFGAFIQMVDVIQQGLVHKAQVGGNIEEIIDRLLSTHRVEEVADVVQMDDPVWVKVVSIDEDDSGKVKIGLSMKYVNQGNGDDIDSGNVNYGREQENRKRGQIASTFNRPPIELTDAVMMNVVCKKCGGKGHLPTECFNAPGENYELIPEEDEVDYDLSERSSHHKKDKKHKKHKKRKRESSRSASPPGARSVNSMADALSVMRRRARKDDKKSHHHHRHREHRRS